MIEEVLFFFSIYNVIIFINCLFLSFFLTLGKQGGQNSGYPRAKPKGRLF